MADPVPIDAEARGKRRLWKQAEARRFARVVALFGDKHIVRAAREFSRMHGRRVASAMVLHRFDSCAKLEHADLFARPPVMLWSAIHTSPESPLRDSDERILSAEERQAASCLMYVMTTADNALIRGLWSSSYTDHSVGRLIQRWPGCDVSAVIREGHDALLAMPDRNLPEAIKTGGDFLVPTSRGAWVCSAYMMRALDQGNRLVLHIRAKTWLHQDMLGADQIAAMTEMTTLKPGDRPCGASLLHPLYVRRGAAAA